MHIKWLVKIHYEMIYTLVCNMPRQIRLEDGSQKKKKKKIRREEDIGEK